MSRKVFSGNICRKIQGAINTAKATIKEENGLFVIEEIIAVMAAVKIPANHTIINPKKISCKLFMEISTPKSESPKFVCISAFQPSKP